LLTKPCISCKHPPHLNNCCSFHTSIRESCHDKDVLLPVTIKVKYTYECFESWLMCGHLIHATSYKKRGRKESIFNINRYANFCTKNEPYLGTKCLIYIHREYLQEAQGTCNLESLQPVSVYEISKI
jgi:hypothetical protein